MREETVSEFWEPIKVTFEFSPGTLLMRREYVSQTLRESAVIAFDRAQEVLLKALNREAFEINVKISVPPEEGRSGKHPEIEKGAGA